MDALFLVTALFFLFLYFLEAFLAHYWVAGYFLFGLPLIVAPLHNDELFRDMGQAIERVSSRGPVSFSLRPGKPILLREDAFLFGNRSFTCVRGKICRRSRPNRYLFVAYLPYSQLFALLLPFYVARYLGTTDLFPFVVCAVVILLAGISLVAKHLRYCAIVRELERFEPRRKGGPGEGGRS